MLLLAFAGMALAGLAVWVVESRRIDERVNQALQQEVDEFRELAAEGVDPTTGRPWESVERLLDVSLSRQVPDPAETFAGFVEGRLTLVLPDAPVDLDAEPEALAELSGLTTGAFGEVPTSRGPMRYAAQEVALPARVATVGQPARAEQAGLFVVGYLVDPPNDDLLATMRTYAAVAAASLLAVALVGWLVAGRLLRPVRLLRRTAQRITDTDLSERIEVTGEDDVSDLARTFNAMLDRLEEAFAAQRQFLDDAGHELRTPLTIVRGHLELLDPSRPHEVSETRALLVDELDRMGRLVDDLSLLAKAERPDFVAPTPTDVGALVDDVYDKVRALGDRRWVVDARAERVVLADPQRLTQALVQLASNAVRFTEEGDVVALGSAVADGTLRLWVRDTGSGVDPADAEHIFERFGRGRGARRADGGTGLGLPIVKAIAEAHGGRVALASVPGEGGATFTLEIPVVPADLGDASTAVLPMDDPREVRT